MKYFDFYNYFNALQSVSGIKGVKFSYAVAKNMRALREEIIIVEDLRKKVKGFDELSEAEKVLDPQGPDYLSDIKKIHKKYPDTLKELEALMKTEADWTAYKVKQADLPDDLTGIQLEGILFMVEE